MSHKEIKIVIQKDGDLRVELPELDSMQMRYYREFFEEVFGKIKQEIKLGEQQPPSGVIISDSDNQKIRGCF